MNQPNLLRRNALLAISSGLVAACSTSPTLDLIARTVAGGKHIPAGRYPMTNEQLRALPFATLGVRIGQAAPSVMVLSRVEGGDLYWVSSDYVIFVTRRGRLIKTKGLKRDLTDTSWGAFPDPLGSSMQTVANSASSNTAERMINLRGVETEQVKVSSSFSDDRTDSLVTIYGVQEEVLRINENVVVADWRWSTQNIFWRSATTGMVLKSRQQYCPEMAPIYLELLKRPKDANV